jgi:hypothetical protein
LANLKEYFESLSKKSIIFVNNFVWVVGGLWVRLGKIKCGVFVSASALAKHLFLFCEALAFFCSLIVGRVGLLG